MKIVGLDGHKVFANANFCGLFGIRESVSAVRAIPKIEQVILFLGAIWKTDEGSSTTKPKGFAYNGCFRQFA
jgi:hypothetical protein